MRLSEIGLKNPYLVAVILLAVFVVGLVSTTRIPADLLPQFKTSAVQILTFYPGMPPEIMERDIMSRLERWTGQSVGIERQEGKAMLGVSVVKDYFREGISLETAMSQVSSYAMSDLYYLPPGTIPPMVMPFDPTASVPLCLVAVSSESMTEKELYDVAYFELRNRLQSIQGVIAPAVYGGVLRRILAYVDRDKLEARGLSPMDVVDALRRQNVLIPAGDMKAGDLNYQLFVNAMPAEVKELNDIPIKIVEGRPIFLRDVAKVKDSHQIQSNVVRVNGRRQVYIPIYRQPGANTLSIIDDIKGGLTRILERLREMNPAARDLALEVVLDQSVYVRHAIRGLVFAGIFGALLAAVVVLLFLKNLRITAIIVLSVPVAILAALVGLFFKGETLNAMTLGGLALAIGILVDQSIVVAENIVRHIQLGEPPHVAAVNGAKEVAVPILVSTVAFVVVFFPIVFLTGMAKFLFTPLAIAAVFAVIASYFFSIVVIPAYFGKFFTQKPSSEHRVGWTERLATWYGGVVERFIKRRKLIITSAGIMFLGAALGLVALDRELFPPVDANQFQILVRLPSGSRIELTEQTIMNIEQDVVSLIGNPDPEYPKVERHPESNLRMLISNIGVLMDWPAAYTPNSGPMDAFVLVQLKGKSGKVSTNDAVKQLREQFRINYPGVEFSFDAGGLVTAALNQGEPAPIHLQVSGSDLHTSSAIAMTLVDNARKVEGITDVRIAQRLDYPILKVNIDRTKAAMVGLDVSDIVTNLVTSTNSSIGFRPAFWIDERNGNHYFIGAQYLEEDLKSFETIRNIPITSSSVAKPALLHNLADFERLTGPAQINHNNITRVIDVYANVLPTYAVGTVVERLERQIATDTTILLKGRASDRGDYYEVAGAGYAGKGYAVSVSGEVDVMRNAFRQFGGGLLIAVILVYLVMVAQLRSFVDPLVIMLAVPLGFIGVVAMLAATDTALSIQAFMGIIMMVGIVIEYSIILIDFANRLVEEGKTVHQAIVDAARLRMRPILMTSLAALLAMLPMALGLEGGEVNAPMARAIVGGIIGATVLTLCVLPCLYIVLKREPRATIAASGE